MVFVREVFCHLFCFQYNFVDGLLLELSRSGIGCFWGSVFAGAFCYADDIVLLAPCASALRIMLDICNSFATYASSICHYIVQQCCYFVTERDGIRVVPLARGEPILFLFAILSPVLIPCTTPLFLHLLDCGTVLIVHCVLSPLFLCSNVILFIFMGIMSRISN